MNPCDNYGCYLYGTHLNSFHPELCSECEKEMEPDLDKTVCDDCKPNKGQKLGMETDSGIVICMECLSGNEV